MKYVAFGFMLVWVFAMSTQESPADVLAGTETVTGEQLYFVLKYFTARLAAYTLGAVGMIMHYIDIRTGHDK